MTGTDDERFAKLMLLADRAYAQGRWTECADLEGQGTQLVLDGDVSVDVLTRGLAGRQAYTTCPDVEQLGDVEHERAAS